MESDAIISGKVTNKKRKSGVGKGKNVISVRRILRKGSAKKNIPPNEVRVSDFICTFATLLERNYKQDKTMKARTAKWFETKVKYEKLVETGLMKTVTETYVVDALSFTETETRIMEEMKTYLSGEMTITDIKPASYKEIFFSDMEADDKWYKAKLQFTTIDEKTEKEKKQNIYYLVQAGSMQRAVKAIDEVMGKTMIDYSISALNETTIVDVFEHKLKATNDSADDKPETEQ